LEGKLRHIGLCNVDVAQLARAQKVAKIVSVQNRYNVSDRSSEPVLKACEQSGLAFIPWFPVGAGGALTKPGGKLDCIAQKHEATIAQIAIAWLLQHSAVMLPIPSSSTVKHLEEDEGAAKLHLSVEKMQSLSV
jgi:aryl-alcohol dehydrogenase-like predicted oxidoreductase